MKFPKKFVFLLAVASGTCWGTYGTFSTLMRDYGIDSGTISLVVPLFYTIFFFILLCRDSIGKIKVAKKLVPFLVFFGFASAIFNLGTVNAYAHLPIGIVSIIVYCNLFLLILFSRIFFHQKITWQKGVAALGAVLGIAMVLNLFSTGFAFSMAGFLWALAAMFFWAVAVTLEKYLLMKGVDGNAVMVYNGLFAVMFLCCYHSPIAMVQNITDCVIQSGGAVLLPLTAFAVITSILAYFFYIAALRNLETSYVQLGFVMDPLTSSVLGFVVFGQSLLPIQIGGIALILFVVIWIQWGEIKKTKQLPTKAAAEK